MKDKPLVIVITLLGGAVCSVCCLLNGAGLLWTLLMTLLSLILFMFIGMIVNKFVGEVVSEVREADREKARKEEEERIKKLELEEKKAEWEAAHPGVPFPEDGEGAKPETPEDAAEAAETEGGNDLEEEFN